MVLDIKICGLKTPDAVAAALDGGATHIGFIFFPKSPRHITPQKAAGLRGAVRDERLRSPLRSTPTMKRWMRSWKR